MLCRPLTPDCQPIIGATNCLGLFVNTGHSFNGWRQASLSAELLAKVVVAGSNSAMGEEAAALYSVERYGLDRPFLPGWVRSVLRVLALTTAISGQSVRGEGPDALNRPARLAAGETE